MFQSGCVTSTCTDGSVKVWSHKGEEITTLYGHTQRVNGCDMSVKMSGQTEEDGKSSNTLLAVCQSKNLIKQIQGEK